MLRLAAAIFVLALGARLCYRDVVWVEEAYPMAAALEMLRGKWLYRDIWFDKPPLFPWLYTWFSAEPGWKLRLAGALWVTFAAVSAFWLARRFWSRREGLWAAGLLAFYLTLDHHAATLVLGPDMLLLVPHLLAVFFCLRGQPFRAGVCCGVGLALNPKAPYLGLVCLIWQWRHAIRLALGAWIGHLPVLLILAAGGALPAYWQQVWEWGFLYSGDPPSGMDGLRRTLNWAGFHAALVAGAGWLFYRERTRESRRFALWLLVSLVAVAAGWRFFPRYYFFLLAPLCILAARGLVILNGRARWAVLALMLIPLVRFGPRYLQTAAGEPWADLALHDDARAVARRIAGGQSVLVWGYRPEVYVWSRVPAAAPWLDSQPLTGVIADRHLSSSKPSAPELARSNRMKLAAYEPEYIVDGLALLNPDLGIARYSDIADWFARYREVARTRYSIIYARSRSLP